MLYSCASSFFTHPVNYAPLRYWVHRGRLWREITLDSDTCIWSWHMQSGFNGSFPNRPSPSLAYTNLGFGRIRKRVYKPGLFPSPIATWKKKPFHVEAFHFTRRRGPRRVRWPGCVQTWTFSLAMKKYSRHPYCGDREAKKWREQLFPPQGTHLHPARMD